LAEKLLVYALGRGLERYDRPALAAITAKLAAADYRFSELVLGIVNSVPFQMREAGERKLAAGRHEHRPSAPGQDEHRPAVPGQAAKAGEILK
jgi:hypothetical protein